MTIFQQIKKRIFRFILQRRLKKLNRQKATVSYFTAKKILVLSPADDPEIRLTIDKYVDTLTSDGKKVTLFTISSRKQKKESSIKADLYKQDLSLFGIPKEKAINPILNQSYDLLIDIHTDNNLPLEYIAAMAKATMKVGIYTPDRAYCYDFMISSENTNDIASLLEQIDHYLKMLKYEKRTA